MHIFQFLIRQGHIKENPLQDIPLLKKNAIVPFIFSPEQTNQLLTAICKKIRKTKYHFLKDLAFYVVVFLLARCGMRISEPLRAAASPGYGPYLHSTTGLPLYALAGERKPLHRPYEHSTPSFFEYRGPIWVFP